MMAILQKMAAAVCILFSAFLLFFSAEVFEPGLSWTDRIMIFVTHALPAFTVLALLIFSRRFPFPGAVSFAALGIAYLVFSRGRFNLPTYLIMAGPLFCVSFLYFAIGILSRKQSGE